MPDPKPQILRDAFPVAFTLVELLVVVAIIVVLLALLTPALDRAMQQAEVAACGTRLQQMGLAQVQYGMAHRWMTTRFSREQFKDINGIGGGGTWYHWPSAPNQINMLGYYSIPAYSGDFGFHSGPTHLYFAKLLPTARSYYCPGDQHRKAVTSGPDYSDGGFFKPSYGDGKILGSYGYNPHSTFKMRRRHTQRWENWDQGSPANKYTDSQAVLAMDVLMDQYRGPGHGPFWNLLHFDGHVARSTNEELHQQAQAGQLVRENWVRFDEYMEMLIETQ